MASPPFDINQALPGDSDIVSQHPTNARAFRDIVESWLLVNHDTNGDHFKISMPYSAVPATPPASKITLFASTTGRLKLVGSDGSVLYVGVPAGNIEFTASATTPLGWLDANGQLVSRSVYADLFAAIGTTFGAGDGSTTFAVPNISGRVIAGKESVASLLTTAGSGIDGGTLGAVGGTETHTLTTAQLASHAHANTVSETPHTHDVANSRQITAGNSGSPFVAIQLNNGYVAGQVPTTSASAGVSISNANAGGSAAHPNAQPTIILRAIIKI